MSLQDEINKLRAEMLERARQNKRNKKTEWDANAPETEEDGYRAGALRILKVRRQLEQQLDRSRASSKSQTNTPETKASRPDDKPNMPK